PGFRPGTYICRHYSSRKSQVAVTLRTHPLLLDRSAHYVEDRLRDHLQANSAIVCAATHPQPGETARSMHGDSCRKRSFRRGAPRTKTSENVTFVATELACRRQEKR